MGRQVGVTFEQASFLHEFETSGAFSDLERCVLRFAAGLTGTPADVSDAVFAELRAHLNEAQIVELASCVAWENYRSRFNRAFRIGAQGFSDGAFCVWHA